MKVVVWDEVKAKAELAKRLQFAMQARRPYEREWEQAEKVAFSAGMLASNQDVSPSFNNTSDISLGPIDAGVSDVAVNYVLKNLRFIHSQLSANPPSVVPRPTSADPDDRRRADAADRLVRYALRQYKLQEMNDRATLSALIYGTCFPKAVWDPHKGDVAEFDEASMEVRMEGDFSFTVAPVWFVYPDPDASCWEDVHYLFEEVPLRYEEAVAMFPGKEELLEQFRIKGQDFGSSNAEMHSGTPYARRMSLDTVRVFEYWETGTASNGMQGRHVWCLPDGTPLSESSAPSPHRFSRILADGRKGPMRAHLPYNCLSDIDVPGTYWGKSIITYAGALQDSLNRLDNVMLDILQAHGVARLLLPENAEIADDSITNSSWDVIRYTGTIPPNFMEPLPMPPSLREMRESLRSGIDDMMGVNDSMMGQMQRETSGFSMQYATQQGNMIRRRLFNKYVLFVEWTYKTFLSIVRENWKETRTIHVLGKEKAFESIDLAGADIQSGFDLVVEYGTSLSLDPMTRREEMLTLMPLFEKAGIPPKTLLNLLKLNELDGAYDRAQMAADRQREEFEEIMAKEVYVAPREMQDHASMLTYAYDFIMTSEFKSLPEKIKLLIEQHIREREQLAASGPQAGAGAAPGLPGMPPAPGAGPALGAGLALPGPQPPQ